VVYAYVSYRGAYKKADEAVVKHVKIGSGTTQAEPIYIYSGTIKGQVMVQYYQNAFPHPLFEEPIPAVGHRVYLRDWNGDVFLDDTRVSDKGFFVFDRVPPGRYAILTETEMIGVRNVTLYTEPQEVVVNEHKLYTLPETFNVILNTKD